MTAMASQVTANQPATAVGDNCAYSYTSQKGYELIQPLLKANQSAESPVYSSLKTRIENLLTDNQRSGLLSSASVYLYSLNDGRWMYINPNEQCNPGSLIKVPMMMTYLKQSESDMNLLHKRILFADAEGVPVQTFTSKAIEKGNTYSVKGLLRYMIAYSDNNATRLLNENVDIKNFIRTFTDLNMPEPDVTDRNYTISAKNISEFFIVLYYATYLSRDNSEYAMELLSQCDFKNGFLKDIPASVRVAHKFGEWGDNRIGVHEIHESGVFYIQNRPYVLTVTTKGTNPTDLTKVVSSVSKMVYDEFSMIADAGRSL